MRESVALRLAGVSKEYAGTRVVDDLTLDVPAGSLTALLGPSGCGKSTTLAIVSGLVEPEAGDVLLGGRSIVATPAERRPVATVFQKPLLFPHLDVEAKVGFGLRMRGRSRDETRRLVTEMLERVELPGLGALQEVSSPAARSSGSLSRVPSCSTRRCSCSTSRSPSSTPR